jgi:murein DD-endopeptidase MepM/ murein hydrolase activator NlpD
MRSRPLPRLRPAGAIAIALAAVLLVVAPPGPTAARSPAPAAAIWTWPVAPPHPVVRAYLAPPTPYGAGHRGIDIGTAEGSPVLAPDDGVVHFAGVVVDRPVLSIEHAGGVLSSFEPVTTTLHAGDAVHRGEVIGTLVAGHCSATACLHLGARVDGEYVNPLVFLGGVPHAVLYPTR